MIEEKRRTDDCDFAMNSFGRQDRRVPLSFGEMLEDDRLDRLCDDVLKDMSDPESDTPNTID